jgi:hypothetical protein
MIDYDGRPGHPPDRTVCGDRRPRCSTSGWTALVDHLRTRGYTDAQLLDAGIGLRTRRGTVVDRFRDRLMFPVRDPGGQRIVGFLGRALVEAEDTPRYLNSPATALYRKGEVLYGLGAEPARRALADGARPVLVEGPLDAIAVTGAGGGRYAGVAPCGTALTTAQVAALDTHAGPLAGRGVITAFDHDPGGRQAALRAYQLLAATGAWPGPPPPPCPKGRTPPPSPSTADRRHCAPPWTPPPHRWRTSSWTSGWPAGPTGCTGSKGSSAPPATPPD